ncbi:signal transduction histidine kinase [Albidovulum inexpectatum]|uniref:histidine kinase n=1 Tax=Albidovulum inexpectatum TaxID=196587 RepID=A0A2S5JHW1_9RHOB|nr:HAMP domain-containing sensor histidine kinase [Albidovulum inexpectatum]PPB80875.1 signal transduction histidine kinase [Albidovulum inexpectatum]
MRSLRRRAMLFGLLWAGLVVAIGGLLLVVFFNQLTLRRFDASLAERHLGLIAALGSADGDLEIVETLLPDPAYRRPYSGRYWQVEGDNGTVAVSRSLFDTLLERPNVRMGERRFWDGVGPDGPVRGITEMVRLDDGRSLVATTAQSLTELVTDRRDVRRSLLATFAFVGVLGVLGAALIVGATLRPLGRLRADVVGRWDRGENLDPGSYPEEVAPLVADINTLLERNREIVERGRRQAADLAHALKTPVAILRNALDAAPRDVGDEARLALDRVEAQLQTQLARIRAANASVLARGRLPVGKSVDRLLRLFCSLPEARELEFDLDLPDGLVVAMDVQDLEEILGNLIENAVRHARTKVRVSGRREGSASIVDIEDDGPGIPEAERREALRSGGRLDVSAPGTGLGLAIASDLTAAYGGELALERSPTLGGLRVRLRVPDRAGLGGPG